MTKVKWRNTTGTTIAADATGRTAVAVRALGCKRVPLVQGGERRTRKWQVHFVPCFLCQEGGAGWETLDARERPVALAPSSAPPQAE
jgi:hypothetical protein